MFLKLIYLVCEWVIIKYEINKMQYKKKGIQKQQKPKNKSVHHHGKKNGQNKDKFSKNGNFIE